MRFGSVCSGIEAASVAWEPLGKFNRKTFEFKVISEQAFVYNDQLTRVFEKMTGLYTSI